MRASEGTPLDRIVAEVRGQRPPQPSEPGLPARLRAELQNTLAAAQVVAPAPGRRRSRWLPQLALAAVLAGAATFELQRAAGPDSARAPASLALLDGQALQPGELVLATDQPRRVQHGQLASWVLAPGSAARLLSASGVLRVALERGSLDAEVEPSSQPASFVVEANGSEVVVHGTRFRVSLLAEGTRVSVTRGLVQVRPIGQGAGTLLEAGMQVDFVSGEPRVSSPPPGAGAGVTPPSVEASPVGAAARGRPPRVLAPAAPSAHPSRPTLAKATPPAAPGARAEQPTPGAPPAAGAEQALAAVSGHAQACFQRNNPGSSELGIEAISRLSLWVEPDGQLLRADFDPPLAPAVEACVTAQLTQLHLSPSAEGYRVERELRLRR